MSLILAQSESELETVNQLLDKKLPSHRQAYSDRTAWVMACMSELAYIRFNPLFSNAELKDYFLESIEKLVGKNKKSALEKLIDIVGYDPEKEKEKLETELDILRYQLLDTFDSKGTQAILVSNGKFITLAFRGTEPTSIRDIKADTKATTASCETGGNIHTGFRDAYNEVRLEIEETLKKDEYKNMPLFITGHSLGGALATVAAKKLSHSGGIAACYTYGAPRVGDHKWIQGLKSPVYRLVNAADCVTMLPPSSETITALGWLAQFIPYVGRTLRSQLLSRFGGYLHGGDMRYLTNCTKGQYEKVELLYAVSLPYRIKGLIVKKQSWKKLLSDHSISVYRKKLNIIAQNRNIK